MDRREALSEGLPPVLGLGLAGTWHLTGCVLNYANCKFQRPWASSVSGNMIYTPNGHMCKSLSYSGRHDVVEDRLVHEFAVRADVSLADSALGQNVALKKDLFGPEPNTCTSGRPRFGAVKYMYRNDTHRVLYQSTPRRCDGNVFITAT